MRFYGGLGLSALAAGMVTLDIGPMPYEGRRRNSSYTDYPDDPSLVQRVIFQSPKQLKADEGDLLGSYKKGKRAKRRLNHP